MDLFRAALGFGDLGDKPVGELVRVRDAALPESQNMADLGPVRLDLTARPASSTSFRTALIASGADRTKMHDRLIS